MKSQHCRTRWHKYCDDAECTCEHHFSDDVVGKENVSAVYPFSADITEGGPAVEFDPVNYGVVVIDTGPKPPPPHPEPYDHGVFRIAEEPLGTDLTQPWVLDYCLECREAVWTHSAVMAAKHESLCESCAYQLLSELTDRRVKMETRQAMKLHNPFA